MQSRSQKFRNLPSACVAVVGLSLCGACSSDSPRDADTLAGSSDTDIAPDYLIGNIRAMSDAGDRRTLARNLAEFLPNQQFVVADAQPEPDSSVVVRGEVTGAVGARGFRVPGDGPESDAASGVELDFDDPRAQWRVIDVTVAVKDSVGDAAADEEHLGIVVDGADHERLVKEAAKLGEVVVVLDEPGFYTFDRKLRQVDDLGTLVGQLDPDGAITFPALDGGGSAFMGGLTTWSALKAEFTKTKKPITTDITGARADDEAAR